MVTLTKIIILGCSYTVPIYRDIPSYLGWILTSENPHSRKLHANQMEEKVTSAKNVKT